MEVGQDTLQKEELMEIKRQRWSSRRTVPWAPDSQPYQSGGTVQGERTRIIPFLLGTSPLAPVPRSTLIPTFTSPRRDDMK